MIKKNTAILIIAMATSLLFGQAIIPHHHHHQKICFTNSHCSHDSNGDADHDHCNCMFDQLLLLHSMNERTEVRHTIIPVWCDSTDVIVTITPNRLVSAGDTFRIHSGPDFSPPDVNAFAGLRAPPLA